MNQRRVIVAFLLSPLAGGLYVVALIVFEKRLWNQLTDILGLASMVLFFAIIGYVAEVALGIPLLCLFRRINRLTLPWFLLGGLIIGVVVAAVLSILLGASDDPLSFALFYCIAPAIISTTLFWFIGWSADNKVLPMATQ
jgi:hypothetical protein